MAHYNPNAPMNTIYCSCCCVQLSYPQGSMYIQCPKCRNTMNPQAPQQTNCINCSTLLAHPPNSLYIQCPKCLVTMNAREVPRNLYQQQMLQQYPLQTKQPKKRKDPNAPKAASNAYMIFCKERRAKLKEEYPELPFGQLGAKLGQLWRSLTAEEKKPYEDKASDDRERYRKQMEEYQSNLGSDQHQHHQPLQQREEQQLSKKQRIDENGTSSSLIAAAAAAAANAAAVVEDETVNLNAAAPQPAGLTEEGEDEEEEEEESLIEKKGDEQQETVDDDVDESNVTSSEQSLSKVGSSGRSATSQGDATDVVGGMVDTDQTMEPPPEEDGEVEEEEGKEQENSEDITEGEFLSEEGAEKQTLMQVEKEEAEAASAGDDDSGEKEADS